MLVPWGTVGDERERLGCCGFVRRNLVMATGLLDGGAGSARVR